jgi:hypothetical protein
MGKKSKGNRIKHWSLSLKEMKGSTEIPFGFSTILHCAHTRVWDVAITGLRIRTHSNSEVLIGNTQQLHI